MNEEGEINLDGDQGAALPFQTAFMQTFLPLGYPESVKKEYLEYQVWDSVQALSSYIRGVLSSRFVFQGLGVGDETATGLGAALAWVYKDGVGIVSSLLFAYKFTPYFDAYPSTFRLVADTLCNLGLLLNMSVGLLPPQYFIVVTSLSSICFACLGIAAGATKSKISSHLAEGGHLGDIIAKESTQESAVTLIGMCCGVALTTVIGDSLQLSWAVFFVCTLFHQYANYRLVKVLQFNTLNNQRLWLLAEQMLGYDMTDSKPTGRTPLPTPSEIAQRESLFSFPLWLCLYGPAIGQTMDVATNTSPPSSGGHRSWQAAWLEIFKRKGGELPYVVDEVKTEAWETVSRRRVVVCFSRECDQKAMTEACLVAYAYCQFLSSGQLNEPLLPGTLVRAREREFLDRTVRKAGALVARLEKGEAGWSLEGGACLIGDLRFRYFDAYNKGDKGTKGD